MAKQEDAVSWNTWLKHEKKVLQTKPVTKALNPDGRNQESKP